MSGRTTVRLARWRVLILVGLCAWPTHALAQSNVGGGPLTSTLADTEPIAGVLSMGPVKVAPGIVVREIGWDSNMFDEHLNPKEDNVVALMPDASVFSRIRFVRVSAYGGADMVYYQRYQDERSLGYAVRGRVDLLLSRIRPFIGVGRTKARTRPNGEVDVRANRQAAELSGGAAFDLGTHSLAYVSAYRTSTLFRNAFEEGVDLGRSLNRDTYVYSGGIKTDLTPLTSLTLFGAYGEDRFRLAPQRDAEDFSANASVKMGPEAVVSGVVDVSYRYFRPVDPLVDSYRGFTGSFAITYPILEVGRFNLTANRGVEYSFDTAEAYFLENTVGLSYTHRLFGATDAQVRGARSFFEYGAQQGVPAHNDTLETAGGSIGYNLRNRTRVSLNYEYSQRRSPALEHKNYGRRRAYLSWTYAF